MVKIILRPGVTNPKYWCPPRPNTNEWKKLRKQVLERDNWTCITCGHKAEKWMNIHHLEESSNNTLDKLATLCPACHAVMHLGFSMVEKSVLEVWKSKLTQVEIVQYMRKKILEGLSLAEIKKGLPITKGPLAPKSRLYASNLALDAQKRGVARAYLKEPLCAVFVSFEHGQVELDYYG